jgi:hypothetical protein
VNTDRNASASRRYLLGEASEEDCSAIEREYFVEEAAIDRIAAVEEDLVEDYIGDRLSPDERRRFERHYLVSPHHQRRLDLIRRLSAKAAAGGEPRAGVALPVTTRASHSHPQQWMALAAALVVIVGMAWMLFAQRSTQQSVARNRAALPAKVPATSASAPPSNEPGAVSATPPHVLALALSPVGVRSVNDSPALIIPAATDVVTLRLEGEGDPAPIANPGVVIRTVAGDSLWRGAATQATDLPTGVIARVDVPAAQLRPDDYVVVLSGTNAAGAEQERYRYFLRVRSR